MKLIIAGSRTIRVDVDFIKCSLIHFGILDDVNDIISGGAQGVDWAAEEFSIEFLEKDAKVMQADWSTGPQAGHNRNKMMAEIGDALLLIWDGESSGSANMKLNMLRLKKPIYEILIKAPK